MKLSLTVLTDDTGLATLEKLKETFRPWDQIEDNSHSDSVTITWERVVQSTSMSLANAVIANSSVLSILIERDV